MPCFMEVSRKWAFLVLGASLLWIGCRTQNAPMSHGVLSGRVPSVGFDFGSAGAREHVRGREVALLNPAPLAARAVTGNAVRVDPFESLLTLAGLDNLHEAGPRGTSLTSQQAAAVLALLVNKPVTLGSFPPRMMSCHLLREVLAQKEVSREELQRRVERFTSVAVLRPDGYLAWALDGRTQQRVGPLHWKDDALRAGPFELGRFYIAQGGVFRHTDAHLNADREQSPLTEVHDDADLLGRSFDGAEDAVGELFRAIGQLIFHPADSLTALPRLPAALVALLASSPRYRERFRYMTRGEQVKAISTLWTQLLVTFGAAAGTTATVTRAIDGLEATVPVLSLSSEGLLLLDRVTVPIGSTAAVLGGGSGAALILYQTGTGGGSGSGKRVSGVQLDKLRQEFEAAKSKFWKHESSSRPEAYSPDNLTRMKKAGHPSDLTNSPWNCITKCRSRKGEPTPSKTSSP